MHLLLVQHEKREQEGFWLLLCRLWSMLHTWHLHETFLTRATAVDGSSPSQCLPTQGLQSNHMLCHAARIFCPAHHLLLYLQICLMIAHQAIAFG